MPYLFLLEGERETSLHLLAQPPVHKFVDVFPSDVPLRLLHLEVLNIKLT